MITLNRHLVISGRPRIRRVNDARGQRGERLLRTCQGTRRGRLLQCGGGTSKPPDRNEALVTQQGQDERNEEIRCLLRRILREIEDIRHWRMPRKLTEDELRKLINGC